MEIRKSASITLCSQLHLQKSIVHDPVHDSSYNQI